MSSNYLKIENLSNKKIPNGWIICKFGDLFDIKGGTQPPKSEFSQHPQLGYVRLLQIRDFESDTYVVYIKDNNRWQKCSEEDILIARYGASLGKICTGKSGVYNVALAKLIFDNQELDKRWVKAFLETPLFQAPLFLVSRSAQNGFNKDELFPRIVPLPPLNEQRRIVAKIEALKARSQRVKEALEDIPQLLDQFRQSVLAAAFCGDLTADWREQNPDVFEWETTTLQEVIKGKPRNGYSPKPVDYPTKVKSITLTATTSGKFKPEYFKYIDEEISIDSYLWLSPGDILIQRSNTIEYVGTCAVYNGSFGEFIYPDLMMKIQVIEEKATSEFIFYALSNKATRLYFRKNATGTAGNMPKINQPIVMNTPVSLPSIAEQKEIVRRVESFFKAAETIEQQYQEAKANLDQLDQSILAKAFRGELVPQDPNDEPASVLLERIRAERDKLQTKAAKKSTPPTGRQRSKKASPQEAEPVQLELGLE
ncbi:restriction endonuclease subunit S [Nostoc sp. FACHB-888]|uniref:restriction endonuclease subunit S n=1 Tax=Nostoc sp. FACHB-888 TaxID=2692842 RepID=UPI001682EBD2|nr:restriction endonuclease subunit S [Nostoc sp. FACHB-888]MBD2248410.1 restriction endonuclease subunit S [Nostoc sp. FACHB-888]